MNYAFKPNQPVRFDNRGGHKGVGFVVGAMSNGVPILGVTYAVEVVLWDDDSLVIPSEVYPFKVIPVFERDLTIV